MSTIRTNNIVDGAGGNTATINGITPALASQAEAEAGTNSTKLMTPERVKQAVAAQGGITLGTAVASTSGTAIDFTSIPAGVRRVTVMLSEVSLSGANFFAIRLGTSSGVETTGYLSVSSKLESTAASIWDNGSFIIYNAANAGNVVHGSAVFTKLTGNSWVCSGVFGSTSGALFTATLTGGKTLSGTLDRVRITTYGGTDTFDAGTINISWEF